MGWYPAKCGNPTGKNGACCCSYCEGYDDGTEDAATRLGEARQLLAEWLRGPCSDNAYKARLTRFTKDFLEVADG